MRLFSRLFPGGGTWSPRVARATTEQPTGADGPLSAAPTHPPPPSSHRLHAHTRRSLHNVIRTEGARAIVHEAGRGTQSRERCRTVADSNATRRPIMASIVRKTTRRTGHSGQENGRGYRNRVERRVIGYRDQTEPLRETVQEDTSARTAAARRCRPAWPCDRWCCTPVKLRFRRAEAAGATSPSVPPGASARTQQSPARAGR